MQGIGELESFYEGGMWVAAIKLTATVVLRMHRAFYRLGREPLPKPPKLTPPTTHRAREPPDGQTE
jgi:hypothetical protein